MTKPGMYLSKIIVGYFLFLLFVSAIPLNGSINIEPGVVNNEPQRDFTLSSTFTSPRARANLMMGYDSQSDMVIIFGGWKSPAPYELGDTWAYNFNTNNFTNMFPAVAPPVREVGAMAYDSQSDMMVMFGGLEDFETLLRRNDTWTYTYDTNTWTNKNPVLAPSIREAHGMVYDSESDRIILFGGNGAGPLRFNDTWAYDIESNTWEEMSPAIAPSQRYFPGMAYDEESDRVILFGGAIQGGMMSDTWAYDYNTDTWVELSPGTNPVGRRAHSMTYDNESDTIVLFGGSDSGNSPLDDIWYFDFNSVSWERIYPSHQPSARLRHSMVYDSESDVIISFGGSDTDYSSEHMVTDVVWVYDANANHWRQMSPITQKGLVDTMMAYDSESDMSIIFGGMDFTDPQPIIDQTWSYDLNSDSYFDLSPVTAPSPRAAGGMAYDSQSDRIVQFGGILSLTSNLATDETWTFDYNTNNWTNAAPAIAPSPRLGTYMTYDSGSDRVILFGGITLNPSTVIYNDTWAYDLETNTWEEMSPTSAPDARYGSAIIYDSESDRVILFGGNPSSTTTTSTFSDTWMYDYELDRWAEVSTTGNPPAGYTGKMAYDSESDKVVFFGGYPDNSERNQTWIFDLNANLWTQVSPNPHPDGRFRHHMVYDVESDAVIMFGGMTGDWFSEESVLDTTWSYDTNDDTWTQMSALSGSTPTTTPTSPTTPVDGGIPWEIVIEAGAALVVVIIVVVVKGVVFPKIEGPGD